jgi:hypothetical protein
MASTTSNPLRFFGTAEGLWLLGLLVLTMVVRGSVLWAMRGNLEQDPDAYRQIAENLLRHGEFALTSYRGINGQIEPRPTAYRPPLYPVVLSNLPTEDRQQISLVMIAVLHVLLGLATVALTWMTARSLLGSAASPKASLMHPTIAPLVAGFLVACDPILLNQQTLIMTETLAAFLAILALWRLARFDDFRSWFDAGLAGGVIGLAVLCRPTFLPWLVLVAIAMYVVPGRNADRQTQHRGISGTEPTTFAGLRWRLANLAAFGICAAVVIFPWAMRNQKAFDRPILTTTHGGYTLLLGNNYEFYKWLHGDSRGLPWKGDPLGRMVQDGRLVFDPDAAHAEINVDRYCYQLAYRVIREYPGDFIRACLYRLRQLWSPLPHKLTADESLGRRLLRYATCAWYCAVYALAAVGIWRLRGALVRPPWIWGVLLCAAFTAVHTVYWTNLRMRAPLVPFVAIVAGAALSGRGTKTERQTDGGSESAGTA